MKKNFKIVTFSAFIVLSFLSSCSNKEATFNEDVVYGSLKKAMVKDPEVALRDIYIKNSMAAIKEDRYGSRSNQIDYKYVEQNMKSTKTIGDRVKVYEIAGYKNAKEMTENQIKMLYHITNINRKYPDLAKLSPEKRSQLFTELSKIRLSKSSTNY
jgi:hypothetical protein